MGLPFTRSPVHRFVVVFTGALLGALLGARSWPACSRPPTEPYSLFARVLKEHMSRETVATNVAKLYEQLAATQELPVERVASRWIGEAEAITGDLVGVDADNELVHRRLSHVVDLLANVDNTGDERADDHLETAKQLAAETVELTA